MSKGSFQLRSNTWNCPHKGIVCAKERQRLADVECRGQGIVTSGHRIAERVSLKSVRITVFQEKDTLTGSVLDEACAVVSEWMRSCQTLVQVVQARANSPPMIPASLAPGFG